MRMFGSIVDVIRVTKMEIIQKQIEELKVETKEFD